MLSIVNENKHKQFQTHVDATKLGKKEMTAIRLSIGKMVGKNMTFGSMKKFIEEESWFFPLTGSTSDTYETKIQTTCSLH